MPCLKPIDQQVIVITGASSGIGLATAEEAVTRGAAVVLAARTGEALASIKQDLDRRGGRVAICAADVASEKDVERIAETAVDAFGGFDSWVNNAGAAIYGLMEEVSLDDHRRIFDVNYFGLLTGSLIAARHLRGRGGGAIVNLGSVLSDRAMILQGPYSATKAAVQAATDALRMELERDGAGISVTLIKPSAIATPYPDHARSYMEAAPQLPPPLYDPKLVAEAILFACETPRRHLYVGGGGFLLSLMGRVAPRVTDAAMEAFGLSTQQKDEAAEDRPGRDKLYEGRSDGSVREPNGQHVRRTSLLLEAQTRPHRLPFAAATAGLHLMSHVGEWIAGRTGTAHTSNQEFIMSGFTQGFIDALRRLEDQSDADAIVSLFAPDAEISNPMVKHEGGGPEAAQRFWTSYRGSFDAIHSEFRNIVEREGVSLLEWASSGTTRTGKDFRYGGVSVIEHRQGRISAFRTYFDTTQVEA